MLFNGCSHKGLLSLADAQATGIPVLNFTGSMDGISKENKVRLGVTYYNGDQTFTCYATLKWQGDTSLIYPKKNFNVRFYQDETFNKKYKVELKDGWGKQSKYCLKANWGDFSQARNTVGGQLYSQVVHSRNRNDQISALSNGGAVDGFPVAIYLNQEFYGLYTLNIPKGDKMFGMDGDATTHEAIVIAGIEDHIAEWELEHCATAESISQTNALYSYNSNGQPCFNPPYPDNIAWAHNSFKHMLDFLFQTTDANTFRSEISNYLDIDRAIDSLLFTYAINGTDNLYSNLLFVTYDGMVWIPTMYDMDKTWGMIYNKEEKIYTPVLESSELCQIVNHANILQQRLLEFYPTEIYERYQALRASVLSIDNIDRTFQDFAALIPSAVLNAERQKWTTEPNADQDHYAFIAAFARHHLQWLDAELPKKLFA